MITMGRRGNNRMNNELYHWKYIKREKKNGKWIYTYDAGAKTAKKNYEQAQKNYIDATNRLNSPRISSIAYREAADKIEKANVRGQKAIPTTKAGREYIANRARHEHAKIELDKAEKAYNKSLVSLSDRARSTVKGMGESIKQKTKDILGFDERDYRDYASDMHDKSGQAYRKERDEYGRADLPPINTEEGMQARLDRNARLDELRDTYFEWGDEYTKANKKFMKTPLGIYTAAADAIEMAAYDASKTAEKVAGKVKDTIEDASFEVEYAVKRSIGIDQKRDYDYAVKELERATKELEKYSKNDNRRYMAEFFKKQAEERYEYTKNVYSGTPLHKIESGVDYVAGIFSGEKKKRKK